MPQMQPLQGDVNLSRDRLDQFIEANTRLAEELRKSRIEVCVSCYVRGCRYSLGVAMSRLYSASPLQWSLNPLQPDLKELKLCRLREWACCLQETCVLWPFLGISYHLILRCLPMGVGP